MPVWASDPKKAGLLSVKSWSMEAETFIYVVELTRTKDFDLTMTWSVLEFNREVKGDEGSDMERDRFLFSLFSSFFGVLGSEGRGG